MYQVSANELQKGILPATWFHLSKDNRFSIFFIFQLTRYFQISTVFRTDFFMNICSINASSPSPKIGICLPNTAAQIFFCKNSYSWTYAFDRNLPRISTHQRSPFEFSEAITFFSAFNERIPLETYPKETSAVLWLNFHTTCNSLSAWKSGESSIRSSHVKAVGD